MISRLKSLVRLATLYEVLEHANGIALDQARAALQEVETRIREREQSAHRLQLASDAALRAGDVSDWMLDQSEIEFARWNAPAVEALRARREARMREAAAVYQASRMQFEQMQSVVHEVRARDAHERERAEQRASDDRFLSRQRWELHDEGRVGARGERGASAEDAVRLDRTA